MVENKNHDENGLIEEEIIIMDQINAIFAKKEDKDQVYLRELQ